MTCICTYTHTIFSAGIQSTSLLTTVTVTVINTLFLLTPTQSILPGRENEQDGICNNITNSVATLIAAVTMGTLNIFFLAVVFVLTVALVHNRKRQVKDNDERYEDIQRDTRIIQMKENKAYGHCATRDTETALSGEAEYEEIDHAH